MFTIPAATPSPPRPHRDSLLMAAAAEETATEPSTSVHQLLRPPTAMSSLLNAVEQSEGRNSSSISPQRRR